MRVFRRREMFTTTHLPTKIQSPCRFRDDLTLKRKKDTCLVSSVES